VKVRELIARLQQQDPTGELDVLIEYTDNEFRIRVDDAIVDVLFEALGPGYPGVVYLKAPQEPNTD
jgi:hypothetical protein